MDRRGPRSTLKGAAYQLHAANGQNVGATLKDLKPVLTAGSEAEAVESLQALTNKRMAETPFADLVAVRRRPFEAMDA